MLYKKEFLLYVIEDNYVIYKHFDIWLKEKMQAIKLFKKRISVVISLYHAYSIDTIK